MLTLVANTLRAIAAYSQNDRKAFIQTVEDLNAAHCSTDGTQKKKRLAEAKRRADELERLLCKIYEDKLLGRLAESRFAVLDERYANEQEQLIREIETLEATIATYENRQQSSERFIALLDKYERFDPLTTTMLNEFVEKILVHERARKGSVETTQEVEIYFKFIGKYVPPHFGEMKLTPEEAEACVSGRSARTSFIRRICGARPAERKRNTKTRSEQRKKLKGRQRAQPSEPMLSQGAYLSPSVSCPRRHPGEQRSKTALQFEKTSSGGMKREQVHLYRVGAYWIPELKLTEQSLHPIGKYGTYAAAVFEGVRPCCTATHPDREVHPHLVETDEAANRRMEFLMPKLARDTGVTERLKASDPMAWVRRMNALKAQVEEIILHELIME